MFNDLHAPLIDSPAATRLFTLLTIAIRSEFVKRRLLMVGVWLLPATIDSIFDAVVVSIVVSIVVEKVSRTNFWRTKSDFEICFFWRTKLDFEWNLGFEN